MRYVRARFQQESLAEAYRFYITDALYIIGKLNIRFADLIKQAPEETRTPEEIKQSIMDKLAQLGG